jgi:hypothetical protein
MFGQPRVIHNPYTSQSHLDWIIERYDVDVFAHTWLSGEEIPFNYSDWVRQEFVDFEHKETANIILEKYKPKRYKFEQPMRFSLPERSRERVSDLAYYSLNNENNTLSHLYSLSSAISLVDDVYDWVIVSRYDNYIRYLPELGDLDNNKLYITTDYGDHFPDHMILGGQRQMNTLNCYNSIPELCNDITMFTPESFKRAAFYKLNEVESKVRLEVGIARTLTLDNLQI